MQPSKSILLALLPLAASTPLSEWAALCVHAQSGQITGIVPCGDVTPFVDCINSLGQVFEASDVESCLATSGCSQEDAVVGASTLVDLCESVQSGAGDLKKRQRGGGGGGGSGSNNDDDADSSSDSGNTDEESDSNNDNNDNNDSSNDNNDSNNDSNDEEEPADDPPPRQTEDEPTDEPTQPRQTEPPTQEATAPPTETTSDNSPVTALQQTDDRPSGTACYSTETITTRVCSMVNSKSECDDNVIEEQSCRDGFLCRIDAQGSTSCMEKVDSLDTGGIIVSIIFGAAIVVSIGMMTFFCCRDKRAQKKMAAKAEAAAIAKASSVGKRARNVSDRQPLMAQPAGPSGPAPGGAYGGDPSQPNPFTDQSRY